eukprot:2970477-Rhodomonas_salina.1
MLCSFKEGPTTLWSIEKAKFRQWQTRLSLSDVAATTLGRAQHDHAMEAMARGARLPAWPYLMDIMATHGLSVIVGPSVFEAPLYTN